MDDNTSLFRRWGALAPLIAVLAAAIGLMAAVLLATGFEGGAAAAGVLAVILLIAGAIDLLAARRALRRHHGDVHNVDADADEPLPTLIVNDDAPLGATSQSHDDLIP